MSKLKSKSKPATTGPNSSDNSETRIKPQSMLKKTGYARIVSRKEESLDPLQPKTEKVSAKGSARSSGGSVGALSRASCLSARKMDKVQSIEKQDE